VAQIAASRTLAAPPVFVGEQLTSNVSSGIPFDTLQVVATYDGNPSPDLALCIQYEDYSTGVQDWITIDASHPFPIGDLGTKFSTYEYDLMDNFPTGRFVVRGVIPNGVVDGIVFGIFWRDNVGGYHMLKSNSDQANTTNDFFGIWPIGFASSATWAQRATGCNNDGNCLIQAQSTLLGAKLLGDGFYSIGIKNDILPGDFDDDCDVDLQDFLEFMQYFTGPGTGCPDCPESPPPPGGACCFCDVCEDGLSEEDCLNQCGRWFANMDCASIDCGQPPRPAGLAGGANAPVAWDNNLVTNGVNGRAISPPSFPNIRVVDDFVVLAGERWYIRDLKMDIIEDATFQSGTTSELYIYADNGCTPGALIHNSTTNFTKMATGDQYFGRNNYEYWLEEVSVELGPGKYWIGTRNPNGGGSGTNYWMTSDGGPDGMGTSGGYFSLDGGNTWQSEGCAWQHAFVISCCR
jgi:hypothetical protein